jgi:hypothetical protein
MVRSSEFLPGFSEDLLSTESPLPLSGDVTITQVPGNHFTMMTDYADSTARAVSGWLAERSS